MTHAFARRILRSGYRVQVPLDSPRVDRAAPFNILTNTFAAKANFQHYVDGETFEVNDQASTQVEDKFVIPPLSWSTTVQDDPTSLFPKQWSLVVSFALPDWLLQEDLHVAELGFRMDLPDEEVDECGLDHPDTFKFQLDAAGLFSRSLALLTRYIPGSPTVSHTWFMQVVGTLFPPGQRSAPVLYFKYASRDTRSVNIDPSVELDWCAYGARLRLRNLQPPDSDCDWPESDSD